MLLQGKERERAAYFLRPGVHLFLALSMAVVVGRLAFIAFFLGRTSTPEEEEEEEADKEEEEVLVTLKAAMAMRKQENMPRECPIPRCSATTWVLNIKTHLARCHPTVPPNTLDLTEWVVVGRDDAKKKKERAKKSLW